MGVYNMRRLNLLGDRYENLVVVGYSEVDKKWICKCDCGNTTFMKTCYLRNGDTKSCGCLKSRKLSEKNYKHGFRKTRFYNIWASMRQRCNNESQINYNNYGGRGITYCKRWNLFENFMEDMYGGYKVHSERFGEKNTFIDRIDVNGNYEPSNCRWVTRHENDVNKRNSRYVNGVPAKDFARENNIPYQTVISRLNAGKYSE